MHMFFSGMCSMFHHRVFESCQTLDISNKHQLNPVVTYWVLACYHVIIWLMESVAVIHILEIALIS